LPHPDEKKKKPSHMTKESCKRERKGKEGTGGGKKKRQYVNCVSPCFAEIVKTNPRGQ